MRFGAQIKTSRPWEIKHYFVYFAYYGFEIDWAGTGCHLDEETCSSFWSFPPFWPNPTLLLALRAGRKQQEKSKVLSQLIFLVGNSDHDTYVDDAATLVIVE